MSDASISRPAGRGVWSLADQCVVSLGSFLTHIVLGRHLELTEYGTFALCLGFIIFLNALHGSLITYPLSLHGAASGGVRLRRQASVGLMMTAVMCVAAGPVLAGATWVLGRPELTIWLIAVLVFWQLQETMRRALMAHLRHREAVWGDGVSYCGQAVAVLVLARTGHLTVEWAFAAIAATSALAGLVQAIQVGLARVRLRAMLWMMRRFLVTGRWLLCTNFLNIITVYATPWTLAAFYGTAQVAAFQAMVNVLGVVNPIMFSVGNLIVPAVAREMSRSGAGGARRVAVRYGQQGAMLLAPYFAVLMLWPVPVLRMFYGEGSAFMELGELLRVFVVVFALAYVNQVMAAALNGMSRSQGTLAAQSASAVMNVLVTLPLAAAFGLAGAVWGGLVPLCAAGVASVYYLRKAVGSMLSEVPVRPALQG